MLLAPVKRLRQELNARLVAGFDAVYLDLAAHLEPRPAQNGAPVGTRKCHHILFGAVEQCQCCLADHVDCDGEAEKGRLGPRVAFELDSLVEMLGVEG